jgi:hypothetical protein
MMMEEEFGSMAVQRLIYSEPGENINDNDGSVQLYDIIVNEGYFSLLKDFK